LVVFGTKVLDEVRGVNIQSLELFFWLGRKAGRFHVSKCQRRKKNLLLLCDRLNPLQQSYRGRFHVFNARGEKKLVAIVRSVKSITAFI
jgi:hypothetical protein